MPTPSLNAGTEPRLKPLAGFRLRANPDFELIPADQLPETVSRPEGLDPGHDLFALLRSSKPGTARVKVLRQEAALLYQSLQEPGHLPLQVQADLGEECSRAIAALVLDQVLEIEDNGRFVSGASAYELLWETLPCFQVNGAIATLSVEALRMTQALGGTSPARLASRLYHYNRMPVSPAWMHRLPNRQATARYFGIGTNRTVDLLLERSWQSVQAPAPNPAWFIWRLRSERKQLERSDRIYKLYVSPRSEFLPDVFVVALATFTEAKTPTFKVGCDVYGLLRSDKLVAYFTSYEEMMSTAMRLTERLVDYPAHGVPFTAEIAGSGMLSWGIDPPVDEIAVGAGQESWRSWLARRMAMSMVEACQGNLTQVEPWHYVLGRLQLDGIDTTTWTPTTALWN